MSGERQADHLDDAVRRNSPANLVAGGLRSASATRVTAGVSLELNRVASPPGIAAPAVASLPTVSAERRARLRHAAHTAREGPGIQLRRGRNSILEAAQTARRLTEVVGRRRVDGAQQFGAGLAVDGAVVQLQVQRETAGRQSLDVVEALDDVGLPQRLAAIERPRMNARDLDAQLAPVARCGSAMCRT